MPPLNRIRLPSAQMLSCRTRAFLKTISDTHPSRLKHTFDIQRGMASFYKPITQEQDFTNSSKSLPFCRQSYLENSPLGPQFPHYLDQWVLGPWLPLVAQTARTGAKVSISPGCRGTWWGQTTTSKAGKRGWYRGNHAPDFSQYRILSHRVRQLNALNWLI